jgi:two-component sensor histidine kinase
MDQGKRTVGRQAGFSRHAQRLIDALAEGLVICEAIRGGDGRLVDYWIRDANPIFVKRAPEGPSAIGRTLLSMRPGTSPWWFERCQEALEGKDVRFQFEDPLSGRWYDAHMMRLSDDEFGQLFMDITERKAAERRQADLFAELNHRVKNNLAAVASILELQARDAPEDVHTHLAKAIGRVRTISDLHGALYQQQGGEGVDLAVYLEGLCAGLRDALLKPEVQLHTRCEPVSVPIEQAVSLGLIVNELVTNAAKHAFGTAAKGQVVVALSTVDGRLSLRVSDDGSGVGDPSTAGLGLRVVRALAKGLDAQVNIVPASGFGVEVILPPP